MVLVVILSRFSIVEVQIVFEFPEKRLLLKMKADYYFSEVASEKSRNDSIMLMLEYFCD